MIATTPFHDRVAALNQTGLWSHWAGRLVAEKYQLSEKFEYFAIRNAAGVFDTSPLFKYRISGRDAEAFLAGVLARDIRLCRPGRAHYTMWCDDRGYVVEDGVVFRLSDREFWLTCAEPNLSYFGDLVGSAQVTIEDVSDHYAALALQGPKSRRVLTGLAREVEELPYFGLAPTKIAGTAAVVSRTGFTGDLGYEIWVEGSDALAVWDAVAEAGEGWGVIPIGQIALDMARIEAGLLLLAVDFHSSRYAWTDHDRSTPVELGYEWMFRHLATDDRAFIGRRAIERELAEASSRWRLMGLVVGWADHDRLYREAGLIAPKDHLPVHEEVMVYDRAGERAGYATSSMYSPILQRHIALARVRPDLAIPGSSVSLELTINHRHQLVEAEVARLPLFAPDRKTS